MSKKTAVMLGATGICGRALMNHLAEQDDWRVIGASRKAPDFPTNAEHLPVDLLDRGAAKEAFASISGITHVFLTTCISKPSWSWADHCAPNLARVKTAIDAIEPVSPNLEHVCLLQGTKYYGMHLGPFKTPAKETDPRHMPPNSTMIRKTT